LGNFDDRFLRTFGDYDNELVAGVFGLPVAAVEVEVIAEGASGRLRRSPGGSILGRLGGKSALVGVG
jgi:hypothetical protein